MIASGTSAGDTNHWFFDKNSTKTVSRWLPYSKPLQRVLDDAKKKCRCNDVEEEAESMEVTELNEAKEVKRVENAVEDGFSPKAKGHAWFRWFLKKGVDLMNHSELTEMMLLYFFTQMYTVMLDGCTICFCM